MRKKATESSEPEIPSWVALPPEPPGRDRFAYYQNGYHMLLRDLEGAKVAADVASWALERPATLPSHADANGAERPWPPTGAGG